MIVVLYPGGGLNFPQYRLDVMPRNTVSEMVSLLSIRFNTLDPLLLEAVFGEKVLDEEITLVDAGIYNESRVQIRPKSRGWCCALL